MPLAENLHSNILLIYEIALDKMKAETGVAIFIFFFGVKNGCGIGFFFWRRVDIKIDSCLLETEPVHKCYNFILYYLLCIYFIIHQLNLN